MSIFHLCKSGIQVFLATHSLFLLRELEILSHDPDFKDVKQRFFSFRGMNNEVTVEQGASIDDLETIVILDEELRQSGRYMEIGELNSLVLEPKF